MRTCHICETQVSDKESCPKCTADFPHRRKAEEMTGEERVQELELLYGPLETEFDLLHQRIEELVGRPVWTHELIDKERLLQEAKERTGRMPSIEGWLAPLKGKSVIIIQQPSSGDIQEAFEDGYGVEIRS